MKIENDEQDMDLTVVVRERGTGRDGQPTTVTPGATATIEANGDFEVVISTSPRPAGELPLQDIPAAVVSGGETESTGGSDTPSGASGEDSSSSTSEQSQLREGSDDEVRSAIQTMLDEGVNLTQAGKPELPILNERLAAGGLAPINAQRRDDLMPQG